MSWKEKDVVACFGILVQVYLGPTVGGTVDWGSQFVAFFFKNSHCGYNMYTIALHLQTVHPSMLPNEEDHKCS